MVAFGAYILRGASAGWTRVAFLVILGLCGFSMFRVWRDQRRYV